MKPVYKPFVLSAFLLFTFYFSNAQLLESKDEFTHADTLRGSNGPGRDWWDVTKYDIHVKFNLEDSTISGWNEISFKTFKPGKIIQIDLQDPLIIDSILLSHQVTDFRSHRKWFKNLEKEGNVYFLPVSFEEPTKGRLEIYYHGKPTIARRPPWDGGVIWRKDKNKNPFISIACQGLGASVWYPCKDIQSDEPDSAEMHITIPDNLECVGNGRFRGKINNGDGTATYDWAVESPINNYNIIPYIGKYAHFSETFKGEAGDLDMDYWVLDYNLDKAKEHFKDAPLMIKAFEYWFGPYPFYKDGYKLVEAPHLGMEHQSATAYGNQYKKGYLGNDLSGSGWGSKWDYIIVHESGHEWFANNISTKDIADMWVHEGFTNYSEVLFTEYYYGKEAGNEYAIGLRRNISNSEPVIGPYGVNKEGSSDMYAKGANMIHTIRQIINDDSLFRKILRGLNKTFWHQTTTSKEVENYISKESGIDFSKVFDQYLRNADIPVLEYKINGYAVEFRYTDCIKDFTMPVEVKFGNEEKQTRLITPTTSWQVLHLADWYDKKTFSVDPNFYINTKKVD
jgi:aminopeptidase N